MKNQIFYAIIAIALSISLSFVNADQIIDQRIETGCKRGPPGDPGESGIIGVDGATGPQGPTGPTGPDGAAGARGDQNLAEVYCTNVYVTFGTIDLSTSGTTAGSGFLYTYVANPTSVDITFLPPFTSDVVVTATSQGVGGSPTVATLTRAGSTVTVSLALEDGTPTHSDSINFIGMECAPL